MGSPSFLTSPIFNMGFLLFCMQLSKKVDWNDPDVLFMARVGYYGAQAVVVALAYVLIAIVRKKNDTTVLTYTPPAKPSMNPTPVESVTTTVRDYDVDQLKQFVQSTVTSILIISLMHWQFKFTQPLFMQSLMPFKNLLVHKEALIHFWGDAAEGSLARPFKADNPFGGIANMLGMGETEPAPAQTPAASHEKKE
ncbi:inorganic phosphate transporter Pho88 [Sporodiniella umbellata]|nr:inorganic phosphate transporter Pho88 [Sporodiniella umbellata]